MGGCGVSSQWGFGSVGDLLASVAQRGDGLGAGVSVYVCGVMVWGRGCLCVCVRGDGLGAGVSVCVCGLMVWGRGVSVCARLRGGEGGASQHLGQTV